VATNRGELLFKRYVDEYNYDILANERDFGTGKKPDFLLRRADQAVVVEVKSFTPQPTVLPPEPGGFAACSSVEAVRNTIKKAAGQLKGIHGYPLVIVLTNPLNSMTPLASYDVYQAMYGDMQFSFNDDGGRQWRTGRNGRLHVGEPDGSDRGHHEYVSAVIVARSAPTVDAQATAWLNQRGTEYLNAMVAYTDALQHAEREGTSNATTVRLDVFETVSDAAYPLPRTIFDGPYDTRWGVISAGHYGRLVPPMDANT
jgi:hypothetical protein